MRDKRNLCRPLTGLYNNTIHQGQSILQSSIVAYWILCGIDSGTKSTTSTTTRVAVPFWDRYPGSGPQWSGFFAEIQGKMSSDGEGFVEAYSSMAKPQGYTEETLNLSITASSRHRTTEKSELVDDWVTITTVEALKRGPLLKSRLTGDAYMCKAVLQNDLLQDPDEGVNYFKNTLKKYFLKGATNVYLYRLLSSSIIEGRPYRTQMQEQLLDISKQPVFEHRLQSCSMRKIQSSDSISRECRTDSGTHFFFGDFFVNCQISREKG